MKVTVERTALLKSLGRVHRVVERRNTIPILANVLIRAEKSGVLVPDRTPGGHRRYRAADVDRVFAPKQAS